MFQFGNKKQPRLLEILDKNVSDDLYLKKEAVERFVPKDTNGKIHFVGAIAPDPKDPRTTFEEGVRIHDSHKVLGTDKL